MEPLSERINALDGFTVVRVFEHVNGRLLDGLESAPGELLGNVPPAISDSADFETLRHSLDKDEAIAMPAALSVDVARRLLLLLAARADLAPLVEESLASYKDNRAMAAEILSSGAAISMIILAATTTFKFKGKNFEGAKHQTTGAQLQSITELVKAVASAFTGSAKGTSQG